MIYFIEIPDYKYGIIDIILKYQTKYGIIDIILKYQIIIWDNRYYIEIPDYKYGTIDIILKYQIINMG